MLQLLKIVRQITILTLLFCINSIHTKASWQLPITNHTQKEYAAGTQNWCVATHQTTKWIYVANNYGLLEFDGLRWQLYGIRNGGSVRSISIANDEKIWVGGENEYGYFLPDSTGTLIYTSMSVETSKHYGNFGSVWNIFTTSKSVYIQTRNYVFIHNKVDGSLQIVQSEENILAAAMLDERIFIARSNGLFDITNGQITHSVSANFDVDMSDVCYICTMPNNMLLIGTKRSGLFTFKIGENIEKIDTSADDYLRIHQLYKFAVNDEYIALGTITGGVVVTKHDGKLVQIINDKNGLQNNTVLSLHLTADNILWCGLDIGIDQIDVGSPMTNLYNQNNSLGTGYAFYADAENFYLGTNRGLYHTQAISVDDIQPNQCKIVEGSIGQVWNICHVGNNLFCCHDKGLFIITPQKLIPLNTSEGFWKVCQLPNASYTFIAGSYRGLYIIRQEDKNFSIAPLNGLNTSCKLLEIDSQGGIWTATDEGVVRLTLTNNFTTLQKELKLRKPSDDVYQNITTINGKIVVSQGAVDFHYSLIADDRGNLIESATELNRLLGNAVFYSDIKTDVDGNVWFAVDDALYLSKARSTDAPILIWNQPQNYVYGFTSIATLNSGKAVVNSVGGFNLANSDNVSRNNVGSPQCYIKQIKSLTPQTPTIYYSWNMSQPIPIPYTDNSINIVYGSTECSKRNVEFRYSLSDEAESKFSEWTKNATKDYTFLHPGNYTFTLQMRLDNAIADTISIQFEVLPPWWNTWWARALLVVCIIILLVAIILISHKRNEAKRQHIIQQNRAEIARRESIYEKEKLKTEKEILRVKNEKIESELKVKSEELSGILLSNVSRNELIGKIKHDLSKIATDISDKDNRGALKRIAMVQEKLSSYQGEKVNWKRFEENFDEVNGAFLQKLQSRFPWLTDNEKRLCVYIKSGLLSKEIAPLMNISVRGVEMLRYRMRKKMELTPDSDLDEVLNSFE